MKKNVFGVKKSPYDTMTLRELVQGFNERHNILHNGRVYGRIATAKGVVE
jgi:hypothetical protein